MLFDLMHKNRQVCELSYNEAIKTFDYVNTVFNLEHAPLGTVCRGRVPPNLLNVWLRGRAIPRDREGCSDTALFGMGLSAINDVVMVSRALSLNDHYWLNPFNSAVRWEDVNFFLNGFSEEFGKMIFGEIPYGTPGSLVSPDSTTGGVLRKRWTIIDGVTYLIKAGRLPYQQEPLNEVFLSGYLRSLNVDSAEYYLDRINGEPVCVSRNFADTDSEFFPAHRITSISERKGLSPYRHLVNCCNELHIENVESFINKRIVFDYIFVNEDRHLNNYGFMRNPDTLEWTAPAPLFDFGNSMWHQRLDHQIDYLTQTACNDLVNTFDELIKLVTDYSWLDFKGLENVGNEISNFYSGKPLMSDERVNRMAAGVMKRVKAVEGLANGFGF